MASDAQGSARLGRGLRWVGSGIGWVRHHGTLAALIALIAVNAAITPNFLAWQTLSVNLSQVAPIAIVALGMTLVIGSGGIDLSVGATMALAGALAPFVFLSDFGQANPVLGVAAGFAVALAAGLAAGFFNAWLINRFEVQPIVATLVLFISGRGLAQVLTGGELQVFDRPAFDWIGTARIGVVPVQAVIALILALALAWVVKRTSYGRTLRAVGGNRRAARLSGIAVGRVRLVTYGICGVLAAIAGTIVSAINSASDAGQAGLLMELDAIAAAVVGGATLMGGRAPVLGAFLGAIIIQLVGYTLLANGVHDAVALVATGAIIIIAVYLQSTKTE